MDGMRLKATAHVRLSKFDENGRQIEVIEQDIELTEEEAKSICQSQQQE